MSEDNKHKYEYRKYVVAIIAIAVVVIYVVQLFVLQIYQNKYKNSADSNAFFQKVLYPARGTIYDRNGKLLVYNKATYDIVFIPREVHDFDTLEFCNILNISVDEFVKRMEDIRDFRQNPGYSTYTQQTFMTQLNAQEYGLMQEKLFKFPGFSIQNRTIREYSYPNAGNILGYVSEVSRSRLDEDDYYQRGDYEGKSGVEKSYEDILRGEKGVEILLRDAHGRIQGRYHNGEDDVSPVSGKNLTLSMDMDLQAYGEYLMQNKIGSIVMIEPKTGEILCMVTAPTFNPALLTGRNFSKNYKELELDPLKPLYNRATLGVYPPGSTFKPGQGLIYLQEGIITKETLYTCHHGWPVMGGHPACHNHASPLSLIPAIAVSCNSYFCWGLYDMLRNRKKYKTINQALDKWKDYLVEMGFGHKLGVDLPFEKRGFIPNSKYYTKAFKTDKWKPTYVISIGIGQGEVTATPLQLANYVSSIANRGYFYTPHIVKNIKGEQLDSLYTHKRFTGISSSNYDPVIAGMANAVSEGTCRTINLMPDYEVCGKTGTAENPHGRDHSLFVGFAPRENPQVAIAVIVENAGFGASFGVPIARLMVEKYLYGSIPEKDKALESRMANSIMLPNIHRVKKKEVVVESVTDSTAKTQSEESVTTTPVTQ